MPPFFPTPGFGWAFLSLLFALLAVACVLDLRSHTLPKKLTLLVLPLGLVANAVRGGLAHPDAPLAGAGGGLLFAGGGLLAGFALFFVLFAAGTCGGGDVKLAAGLGAWVGPTLSLALLALTVPLLAAWLAATVVLRRVRGRPAGGPRWVNFSVPVTLALLVLLPWAFRHDLHLTAARGPAEVASRGP